MTQSPVAIPATLSLEHAHPRTEAAMQRLRHAMREIEAEVAAHHGVYPFNHGRVTQSELCRRADVKKATLQNAVHKDTTRVEIMAWLDTLAAQLSQTRDSTRERVTAVADGLAAQVQELTHLLQASQAELAALRQEHAELAQALQQARDGGATFNPVPPRG
jgi:DNA repair exonuclease SbcCD ATPase subunit